MANDNYDPKKKEEIFVNKFPQWSDWTNSDGLSVSSGPPQLALLQSKLYSYYWLNWSVSEMGL